MTFHASLPLVAFSSSVTLLTLSYYFSSTNIFSRCFFLLRFNPIIPVVTRFGHKKIVWRLRILFIIITKHKSKNGVIITILKPTVFCFFLFLAYQHCSVPEVCGVEAERGGKGAFEHNRISTTDQTTSAGLQLVP